MNDTRKLTGKWYLKPRFLGGFKVMVEVSIRKWRMTSPTGAGSFLPEQKEFVKASSEELIKLKIASIIQG